MTTFINGNTVLDENAAREFVDVLVDMIKGQPFIIWDHTFYINDRMIYDLFYNKELNDEGQIYMLIVIDEEQKLEKLSARQQIYDFLLDHASNYVDKSIIDTFIKEYKITSMVVYRSFLIDSTEYIHLMDSFQLIYDFIEILPE